VDDEVGNEGEEITRASGWGLEDIRDVWSHHDKALSES
jgi:hypothetical protein